MLSGSHIRLGSRLTSFIVKTWRNGRFVAPSCILSQKIYLSRTMSDNKKSSGKGSPPDTYKHAEKRELTGRQKLRLVFAEYGVTAVVFHTTISLTSLGLCYIAISSGLDVPGFLIKIGLSESASQSIAAKGASTFVIAYACHKVFMPVRIFMTVTCTPIIVHRLRSLGLIR